MTFALSSHQKRESQPLSKCHLRDGEGNGKLNVAQEVTVEVTACNIDIKCGVSATHGGEYLTLKWRLPF